MRALRHSPKKHTEHTKIALDRPDRLRSSERLPHTSHKVSKGQKEPRSTTVLCLRSFSEKLSLSQPLQGSQRSYHQLQRNFKDRACKCHVVPGNISGPCQFETRCTSAPGQSASRWSLDARSPARLAEELAATSVVEHASSNRGKPELCVQNCGASSSLHLRPHPGPHARVSTEAYWVA